MTNRHDRQTDKQTDRQKDKQTDKHTNRQTNGLYSEVALAKNLKVDISDNCWKKL